MYVYIFIQSQTIFRNKSSYFIFEQILVNQCRHPVDIATCVKCKIYRGKKDKRVRGVPATVHKNHNVVCLTLIKVF